MALMIRYLAAGGRELDEAAPVDAGRVLGGGLLLAALSALAPAAVRRSDRAELRPLRRLRPLAEVATPFGPLTLLGSPHLVTSVFFDIGVYLVVIGVMLDLARSLGAGIDQHEAEDRTPAPQPTRARGRRAGRAERSGAGMSPNLTLGHRRRRAGRRRGLPAAGTVADPHPGRRAARLERRQRAVPGGQRGGRRRPDHRGHPAAGHERPAAAGDGADRDRDHPRGDRVPARPWPTAASSCNGHDEVADDVEDAAIRRLAEEDLASGSYDEAARAPDEVGRHRRAGGRAGPRRRPGGRATDGRAGGPTGRGRCDARLEEAR